MPIEYKYNSRLVSDLPCWLKRARVWSQGSRTVKQVRRAVGCWSGSCRWQVTSPTVSTHPDACTAALIKVRQSLGRGRITDVCQRNDMLEWQSHQGNYGYAPGRSDPENRIDLQQPMSHLCLLSVRSLGRRRCSHGLHSETSTEEAVFT